MMALSSLGRWVYPVLAFLLLTTWGSGGAENDPMEFTVKVFPVTDEAVSVSDQPEPTRNEPKVTSVMGDQSTATTSSTPPATTTTTTTMTPTSTTQLPTEAPTSAVRTATTTSATTTTATTVTTTTTRKPTTETTVTTTLPTTTTTENPGHCPKDPYCDGELFPLEFYVAGHKVGCDHHPRIHENCCLPHGRHLVCYNITVDGEYLNYAPDRPSHSTDYMELCDVMVLSQNATSGPYSTISKTKGGGRMAFRYNEWAWVTPDLYKVKDVACMIREQEENRKDKKKDKKDSKTGQKKDGKEARENSKAAEDEENKLDSNDEED